MHIQEHVFAIMIELSEPTRFEAGVVDSESSKRYISLQKGRVFDSTMKGGKRTMQNTYCMQPIRKLAKNDKLELVASIRGIPAAEGPINTILKIVVTHFKELSKDNNFQFPHVHVAVVAYWVNKYYHVEYMIDVEILKNNGSCAEKMAMRKMLNMSG